MHEKNISQKIEKEWTKIVEGRSFCFILTGTIFAFYEWKEAIHFYRKASNTHDPYGSKIAETLRAEFRDCRCAVKTFREIENKGETYCSEHKAEYIDTLKNAFLYFQYYSDMEEDIYYLKKYIDYLQHPDSPFSLSLEISATSFSMYISDNINAQMHAYEWVLGLGSSISQRLEELLEHENEVKKRAIRKKLKSIYEKTLGLRIPIAEKYINEIFFLLDMEPYEWIRRTKEIHSSSEGDKHAIDNLRIYGSFQRMTYDEADLALEALKETLRNGSFISQREYRKIKAKPYILLLVIILILFLILQD